MARIERFRRGRAQGGEDDLERRCNHLLPPATEYDERRSRWKTQEERELEMKRIRSTPGC